MLAKSVFDQNNGDVTKAYYKTMDAKGLEGQLCTALFRAQKRSTAAKKYRGGKFRHAAYDVKNWSLSEICRILGAMSAFEMAESWGWSYDKNTPGFNWVLYVDLPNGQCSFHSKDRLSGPDYRGKWAPGKGSEKTILDYCDSVYDPSYKPSEEEQEQVREEIELKQSLLF